MPNSLPAAKPDTHIKAALLLLFLAFIIYSNSLAGQFVYDDGYFIVKNIHIRNLENIPSFFVNPSAVAFSELAQDVYRPLTTISYALDYHFWGLDVFGYHLENVLFHGLNAVLLYILLILIFENIPLAFLASLFFTCQPIQTEVVSWISGRSSVLFLFFYLASFICYVLYTKRRNKIYLVLSIVLCFKSLFSKEMAISLPLLLAAYEVYFGAREGLARKTLRLSPYFLLTAFFVAARFLVINRVSQTGWWGGSPYHTGLTMMVVMLDYVKLLIAPVKLCAFYVTTIYASITTPKVLASAAFLLIAIAAVFFLFNRSRRASFAISLFLITLLPVSNIVPLRALMAERFLYLPSIGFCILLALGLERLSRARIKLFTFDARKLAIIAAAALVIFYSVRTMMRNEDWKTPIAITNSILKIDPLNPWGLMSLGVAYSAQEQYELALKPLTKAMILSSGYFAPRSVLGFCYLQLGRYDEAIKTLTEALTIKPDNLEALNSLGVAYAQSKRYEEAIKQFEHAVKVDPAFIDGYINLGAVYEHMGRFDDAIRAYERVETNTRSAQSIAISYLRIGDVYIKSKDPEKAKAYYRRAADLCGAGMEELKKVAMARLNAKWGE